MGDYGCVSVRHQVEYYFSTDNLCKDSVPQVRVVL